MEFSKHLQRIVRTFDRAGESRLSIVYVSTSHHNKRFVSIVQYFVIFSLDCKQSLFFFRCSEGSARKMRETRAVASPVSRLQSLAWSI